MAALSNSGDRAILAIFHGPVFLFGVWTWGKPNQHTHRCASFYRNGRQHLHTYIHTNRNRYADPHCPDRHPHTNRNSYPDRNSHRNPNGDSHTHPLDTCAANTNQYIHQAACTNTNPTAAANKDTNSANTDQNPAANTRNLARVT